VSSNCHRRAGEKYLAKFCNLRYQTASSGGQRSTSHTRCLPPKRFAKTQYHSCKFHVPPEPTSLCRAHCDAERTDLGHDTRSSEARGPRRVRDWISSSPYIPRERSLRGTTWLRLRRSAPCNAGDSRSSSGGSCDLELPRVAALGRLIILHNALVGMMQTNQPGSANSALFLPVHSSGRW
jgi:hypothetical protein